MHYNHQGSKSKVQEPQAFNIYDADHNVLVLDEKTLKAIPMKTYINPGDSQLACEAFTVSHRQQLHGKRSLGMSLFPEIFLVLPSHLESATVEKGSPIFLAVSKGTLCLHCDKEKGKHQPSLQMKNKKLTSLHGQKETAQKPFIFYKAKVGSRFTLESAAYPGWFVCTSCKSGAPVGVTNTVGKKKHIEFLFKNIVKVERNE
ncbi:interleukin-37 [Thomomys bottae]